MASRDIMQCVPPLRSKWVFHKTAAAALGIDMVLTCTARSYLEQIALYAQGRETLAVVNQKRQIAGLPPVGETQNMRAVTWTLDSKHVVGVGRTLAEAYDVAVRDRDGRSITWNLKADVAHDGTPDYLQLAQIGRDIHLRCGADFKGPDGKPRPDWVHYEV